MEDNGKVFFCTNCGKPLAEGARFCEECGAPVADDRGAATADVQETVTNAAGNEEAATAEQTVSAAGPNRGAYESAGAQTQTTVGGNRAAAMAAKMPIKNLKTLIIAAAVVAVIVIVAILAIANHKKTINLEKYVTYEFYGYDTAGTASISLDYSALEDAVLPTMEKKLDKNVKKYGSQIENILYWTGEGEISGMTEDEMYMIDGYMEDENVAYYLASVSADVTSGLTNDDEITITFDYDNELLAKYGLKFKGDTMTVTVADLPEAETVDVFADVELDFSGASPFLSTSSYYTVDVGDYEVTVNVEPYEYLSIGDEVTLTVDTDDFPDGYVPKEATKTITVENATQYIQKLEDITDDLWSLLKTQAEDELTAYTAEHDADEETFDGMEYQGAYLLTPKTLDDWDYETKLYLVYKVNQSNPNGTVTYYWYIEWENPMLYEDGTAGISNITGGDYPETNWFSNDGFVESGDDYIYPGYASIDILYSEIITPQVGDYSVETDIQ